MSAPVAISPTSATGPSEFSGAVRLEALPPTVAANRALMVRALLATLAMIVLFFAGVVPAKAAIVMGGLLLPDGWRAAGSTRRSIGHCC